MTHAPRGVWAHREVGMRPAGARTRRGLAGGSSWGFCGRHRVELKPERPRDWDWLGMSWKLDLEPWTMHHVL